MPDKKRIFEICIENIKGLNPNYRFSSLECANDVKKLLRWPTLLCGHHSSFYFFPVYLIAAINGYDSSSLHLLDRRTRQIQNGTTWPIGSFHGRQLPTS
jgi:hypothetical protein